MDKILFTMWWRGFQPEEKLRQQQRWFSTEQEAREYLERCNRDPDIYVHKFTIFRLVEV